MSDSTKEQGECKGKGKRYANLTLTITDDKGNRKTYRVIPAAPATTDTVARWWVCHQATNDEYLVEMLQDGSGHCSCTGFFHARHCKHVDALRAMNVMASELQKLSDERRQTLDRLLARLAEAEQQLRDLKAKHRARQQRYTAKRKARQAADADSRAALNEACPW